MPAFSVTAPTFSDFERQVEKDGLSMEEKQELERDLHGTDDEPLLIETPSLLENARAMMEEALALLEDKQDYMDALAAVPNLVAVESNPILFLRCENYDAWKAAQRCADYWKVRKNTFGGKAYLPMTLNGAMSHLVDQLAQGVVCQLPPDARDRPVVYWDRIRSIRPYFERDHIVQMLFYVLQVVSENEEAQRRGYVSICNVRNYDLYTHFDRIQSRRALNVVNAVPVTVKASHYCGGSGSSAYTSVVAPVISYLIGKRLRLRKLFHKGSDQEVIAELQLYGLGAEHVPVERGGNFKREHVLEWLHKRRELEEGR